MAANFKENTSMITKHFKVFSKQTKRFVANTTSLVIGNSEKRNKSKGHTNNLYYGSGG